MPTKPPPTYADGDRIYKAQQALRLQMAEFGFGNCGIMGEPPGVTVALFADGDGVNFSLAKLIALSEYFGTDDISVFVNYDRREDSLDVSLWVDGITKNGNWSAKP